MCVKYVFVVHFANTQFLLGPKWRYRTGAWGAAFHLRKTKAKNTVENVFCRFLSASFFSVSYFPPYLCTIAAVTAGSGSNSGASSVVILCLAQPRSRPAASLAVSSFIYICFILLSWLTGARSLCTLLGTGFRPARAHLLAGVGCLRAPCHLSRIVPNSTFCNYKNPREGLRGLQSGGRRLRKQRVGVLWCSLKFVALISIVLCIIVVAVVVASVAVAVAVFGIVAAVFSAFSYPGKVYGVLKVCLQLLMLLFKCAQRI